MQAPEKDLVDIDTITKEELIIAAETAGIASDIPEFRPTPSVAHGIEHIKSRLILATTAWNNNFGYKRNCNILTTVFIADNWSKISEAIIEDVKKDAADLHEVMWKPISYLINEIVTGYKNIEGQTFAAVLTTGQYVYLALHGNNFSLINSGNGAEDLIVPATKIVMLRLTSVKVPETQSSDLEDGKYIRALAPATVNKPRYTLKEHADDRHDRKMLEKRRKANKAAKVQKRKNRK